MSAPITQLLVAAEKCGVHVETMRRARRRAGESGRRIWFANEAELHAWWRRIYLGETEPAPERKPRSSRRRSTDGPLDVAALRAELTRP